MKDWKNIVCGGGQSASTNHTEGQVVITDAIDEDDSYHLEMGEYRGEDALHARTQQGMDCLLQEFGVAACDWHKKDRRR